MIRIAIPLRDREWILEHFFEHVLRLDYPKKDLIIDLFVNDSDDKTLEICQSFKKKNEKKYNNIFLSEKIFGVAKDSRRGRIANGLHEHLEVVRNIMLERTQDEDYVFMLDSDILVQTDVLKVLVGCNLPIVASIINNGERSMIPNALIRERNGDLQAHRRCYEEVKKKWTFEVDWTGAIMLMIREVAEKIRYKALLVGNWRTGEDLGFCLDAQKQKYKLYATTEGKQNEHIMSEKMLEEHLKNCKLMSKV